MRYSARLVGVICGVVTITSHAALVFSIVPASTLPTTVTEGSTTTATYTVTNNALSTRTGNYVRYLPPNVTQSGGTCGTTTFTLASGASCTLGLTISGAVNGNDPDQTHHLFVCYSGGITCAGTNYPLNVTVVSPSTQLFTAGGQYTNTGLNSFPLISRSSNSGQSFTNSTITLPIDYVDSGIIRSVSDCSSGTCVAVGQYNSTSGNQWWIYRSSDSGQTWSTVDLSSIAVGGTAGDLFGVSCGTTNTCSAVGLYEDTVPSLQPGLLYTTNGGATWSLGNLASLGTDISVTNLNAVYCNSSSPSTCFAVGTAENTGSTTNGDLIITSTDGGVNWSGVVVIQHVNEVLNSVFCQGSTCVAGGNYKSRPVAPFILYSNNTGATWTSATINGVSNMTINGVYCSSSTVCYAVGEAGASTPILLQSTDSGQTWNSIETTFFSTLTAALNDMTCKSANCVIAGSEQSGFNSVPMVLYSTDSGANWTTSTLQAISQLETGFYKGID